MYVRANARARCPWPPGTLPVRQWALNGIRALPLPPPPQVCDYDGGAIGSALVAFLAHAATLSMPIGSALPQFKWKTQADFATPADLVQVRACVHACVYVCMYVRML